jgi:hypothetical protein
MKSWKILASAVLFGMFAVTAHAQNGTPPGFPPHNCGSPDCRGTTPLPKPYTPPPAPPIYTPEPPKPVPLPHNEPWKPTPAPKPNA